MHKRLLQIIAISYSIMSHTLSTEGQTYQKDEEQARIMVPSLSSDSFQTTEESDISEDSEAPEVSPGPMGSIDVANMGFSTLKREHKQLIQDHGALQEQADREYQSYYESRRRLKEKDRERTEASANLQEKYRIEADQKIQAAARTVNKNITELQDENKALALALETAEQDTAQAIGKLSQLEMQLAESIEKNFLLQEQLMAATKVFGIKFPEILGSHKLDSEEKFDFIAYLASLGAKETQDEKA